MTDSFPNRLLSGESMPSTRLSIILTLPFLTLIDASAQSTKVDVYTAAQMTSTDPAVRPASSPTAGGPGILERYPNHYTMLITRHEDGQSELHQHIADTFFVIEGEAQLWSGGSMQNDKVTAPGERRGSGLSGATSVTLHRGDVVHIPGDVPHQLRLPRGSTFTYFVVKVDESAEPKPAPR